GKVKGFLVETPTEGFHAEIITGKGVARAVWQADITLDEVRVPESNRLPGANTFKDTGRVLVTTRAGVAWAALGHAVAAYDTALTYAKQRTQFMRPLVAFQIVQDRLVRMLAEVTAMQLYCMQIARLAEAGRVTDGIAGLAKLNNTRKARQVIAEARDLLGGNGILLENHVIRHMSDIEMLHTYEGTETIQTLIVGRDITGVGAFA
ncbi:MAG TPA: acyl-CoA dehydrogenase family protein, partial [Streptosporangiaceae bacterium]|nr:acyl-CoA dehydrogenase family protein [Streptosporangiaceae bacterium]